MKKYLIIFVYLAGLAPLSVWKDKLVSEIGVWPSVVVAIGYLLILGMFGLMAARSFTAMRALTVQKQIRIADELNRKERL